MTSIPLRQAITEAITERLAAALNVPVDRARRAPIDTDRETLPRLDVAVTALTPDETQAHGETHWTATITVRGFDRATADDTADIALSQLHALVVAALSGWTPARDGLQDPQVGEAEFRLYDAEESAKPAGEFTATFTLLAVCATGNPYL